MSLKRKLADGLWWQGFSIVSRQGLSFVVFAVLARILEPSAFGAAALVALYLGFARMFVEQGLSAALVQRQSVNQEHFNTAFTLNLLSALVLCILTIACSGVIAAAFGQSELKPLLQVASLTLVIGALSSIHNTILTKELDFRRPAVRTLVANVAGGVVGIAMALGGGGVWSLVMQQIVASLAGTVFLWFSCSYRPKIEFSRLHASQLMPVSIAVFATSLLWFASTRLHQFFIGTFASIPALGLYVIAGKVPEMAKLVTHQPLAELALPALAQLQGDRDRLGGAVYKGMRMNALIACPIFLGLAAIAEDLIPLLFGAQWKGAGQVCGLLCVYTLANCLQVFFHPLLLASGGVGSYVLLNVLHAVGVTVACWLGIKVGVVAVAGGLILNSIVVSIPALIYLQRRLSLDPMKYCRPCVIPLLSASLMFFAVTAFANAALQNYSAILRVCCSIILGVGIYYIAMLLLDPKCLHDFREFVANRGRSSKPVTLSS